MIGSGIVVLFSTCEARHTVSEHSLDAISHSDWLDQQIFDCAYIVRRFNNFVDGSLVNI
jgi:hypothetical protein